MPWVPAVPHHLAGGTHRTGQASFIAILELEKPRGGFFCHDSEGTFKIKSKEATEGGGGCLSI